MELLQKRKYWILSLVTIGLVGTIFLSFQLNFRKKVIFPVPDLQVYELGTYHEDIDSNWSTPAFRVIGDKISFQYQLTQGREEPFAAFYFRHIDIDSNLTDVQSFDHLQIYLSAKEAQRIPITMRFRNDSILGLKKSFPEISVTTVIEYKVPGNYKIPLEEFHLAAWWLRYHGLVKEDIDLTKTTELKYLSIGSCQALEPGGQDEILIGEVIFYNENGPIIWMILSLWLSLGLLFLIVQWSSSKPKEILVEHISLENEVVNQTQKALLVKQFIAKNYTNSDLTMYHLQRELKLSANEIRGLFKDEIKDTFKNYVKSVRLIEVKRLLLETDLTIAEVAYKCGFNDIPHFNRQFKSAVGITPKQFRNQKA